MQVSWRREGLYIEAETNEERQFLVNCLESETFSVAIRFYPDPVIERWARWSGNVAFILDEQFVTGLLPKFATREKLIVKVGTESGVIDLTGAAQAVQDLRQGSGLLPQQTLEIPTH